MRRLLGYAGVVAGLMFGGVAGAQVYRWDTGEKLSDVSVERGARFDGASLDHADFAGKAFWWAFFTDASLNYADFTGSDAQHANFKGISANHANFVDSNLKDASFEGASLNHARFTGSKFKRTSFEGASLEYADFSSSVLTKVYFSGASLDHAGFAGSDLSGGRFGGISLNHVDFEGSNLTGVGFYGASLVNANFSNANLRDAHFHDYDPAKLIGANFAGADIRGALVGPSFSPSQLYSTASYEAGDLEGMRFEGMDLAGWRFENQNLDGVSFERTQVADANFAGSILKNANLTGAIERGFSQSQLESSASYQNGDLSGIDLRKNDLTDWRFAGQNLEGANFDGSDLSNVDFSGANLSNAQLGHVLTGANLTDAIITGAKFRSNTSVRWEQLNLTPLTQSQFYSTASYKQRDISGFHLMDSDLTGWDFAGQSLRDADLRESVFTDVNLTGADIRGINLSQSTKSGFGSSQLYSTASYQQGDLSGVVLKENDLQGWNLSGQKMTGANLSYANLTGANLAGVDLGQGFAEHTNFTNANLRGVRLVDVDMESADLTGADMLGAEMRGGKWFNLENLAHAGNVRNLIRPDGSIQGGVDVRAGEVFSIRDYDTTRLRIDVEGNFNVADGGTLSFVFDDENWGSTIRFEEDAEVSLDGRIELILDESSFADLGVGMKFGLFSWWDVLPQGEFEVSIPQSGVEFDLSELYTKGTVTLTAAPSPVVQDWESTPEVWGHFGGGVTVFPGGGLGTVSDPITFFPAPADPDNDTLGDQLAEMYGPVAELPESFTRGIERLEGETIAAYFARLGYVSPSMSAPAVPEPSTLMLLVGVSVLGWRRGGRG